jgi:hypothetical protein
MHSLRTSSLLPRLVLAWFVLMLGVAGASPIVHAKPMEVVCASGGFAKIVLIGDEPATQAGQHTLDCPMCFLAAVPLPAASADGSAPRSWVAHGWVLTVAARMAVRAGAPLPARGPPALA